MLLALLMALQAPPEPPPSTPGIPEKLLHAGETFIHDLGYLATAPLRPSGEGLLTLAGSLALIGIAYSLDDEVRDLARRNARERVIRYAGRLDEAGESEIPWVLGIGLTSGGLVLGDARLQRTGLEVLETTEIVEALVLGLKRITGRSRPFLDEGPDEWDAWGGRDFRHESFPSSRTAHAFSIAVILAEEYPPWGALAYGAAALVGWARIQVDDHWTSDVVAAALLSIVVGKTLVWLHAQEVRPPLLPWIAGDSDGRVAGLSWSIRF